MIAALATVTAACALAAPARPVTLEEAIDIAVGADALVSSAASDVERARLAVLRANLERVQASVDASVQEVYDKGNLFGPDPPGSPDILLGLSSLEARVDVPIFSGFRVEAGIARAELLAAASGDDVEDARRRASVAVARAYWSERRLALLVDAQARADERLSESERLVRARVGAGLAAGLDINRALSRRASLDVQRAQLAGELADARTRLAVLLGDPALVPSDAPPPADADVAAADALVQAAFDARPELAAAEKRLAALAEEKRIVQAAYWPQLGAGALAQLGNNPAVAGAGNRSVSAQAIPFLGIVGDVQLGVGVSLNLFDTWATSHGVQDVDLRRSGAHEQLRALRRDIELDVRGQHARLVGLVGQRHALVTSRSVVEDNDGILQRAYQRGEVPLTEVLDAQLELADAERAIVDLDAQLALARAELALSVGGKRALAATTHGGGGGSR